MHHTVIGNWKMNGTLESAAPLASGISDYVSASVEQTKVVLCPPALHLAKVIASVAGSNVSVGGQNCHTEASGAYTGDVSAEMLKDVGAEYVIVGHSERRAGYGETNAEVAAKAQAVAAQGMIPVICIGETLAERESGEYKAILQQQARESVPASLAAHNYLLAYEPVWAIGTGKVADALTIEETHQLIADVLSSGSKILYGGSVKADNAEEIMGIKHVDGVLVGGASLQAESFNAIIAAAEAVALKL